MKILLEEDGLIGAPCGSGSLEGIWSPTRFGGVLAETLRIGRGSNGNRMATKAHRDVGLAAAK